MEKYQNLNLNYINGQWRNGTGDNKIVSVNPYNGEEMATFQAANLADINEAYETAAEHQKAWAKTNPFEVNRIMLNAIQIMKERYQEIVDLLVRESGSTVLKASVEVDFCMALTGAIANYPFEIETIVNRSMIPGKTNYIIRKPVGVVGVIGPFNFPLYLGLRSVAPALAAGNGVVLKPASTTPITGGTLLAKIFEEAGVPAGVFSVVVPKTSEIGDAFYEHPIPDVISFTGSVPVGSRVGQIAGSKIKKTMLELGGNNCVVVLDDADIDYAVRSAAFGRFLHSGQICMSSNRIIVDESIFDEFAKKFVEVTKNIKVGDPAAQDTLIGPLITEQEAIRVMDWVEKAKAEGAEILLEGKREGTLVYPYVIKATNDTYTAKNEIFGPVANLICVKGEEEALHVANDTDFGLSGAVITSNKERGFRFAEGWKTGMVHINDQSVNDEPYIAFGGEKQSGIGRYGRAIALDEVTTFQWVSYQEGQRPYPV